MNFKDTFAPNIITIVISIVIVNVSFPFLFLINKNSLLNLNLNFYILVSLLINNLIIINKINVSPIDIYIYNNFKNEMDIRFITYLKSSI